MENNGLAIVRLIILSIIAIVLIMILCVLLIRPENAHFSFNNSKSSVVYDEKIESDISLITVDVKSSDVRFELTDEENLNVKIYGKEVDQISVDTVDKELRILEKKESFCFGFCFNNGYSVIVSVPRNSQYNLDISTISGDINIDSVITNNLKVNTVSGDITAKDYSNGTFGSVSGDLKIGRIGVINAKTVSGEINIDEVFEKADLKTTSGDIEINALNITKNSKINTISGDVDIHKNNSYIITDTVSGDTDILNNNRHAEVEINIKTTSGDIEVGE